MKRPRIMHVVVAGDIGGAERLLVDLAGRPAESGAEHEIALVTPNRALAAYFTSAGLTVHDRGPARENPLAYLWRSLGPADTAWLAGLLASRAIDVVHTHTFGSHVLGTRAALRAGRPQLRTEHHVMHFRDASTSPFTRWAAARTQRFVAVSEYVRRTIAETAPALAPRMVVVRNGVDVAYWTPTSARAGSGPARSEGADAGLRAVVVCRLTAWKRVELAILAAAEAEVELTVVGDGEERAKLEALARAKGARVRFVGHMKDPRPFVADADLTISASKDEPLGLSVLESMAMERAVLAYAGGGIPELVVDGARGRLVTGDGAGALAAALREARGARETWREMGRNARRFVERECTIEHMCELYAREYRALAGVTPAPAEARQ